MLPVPTIDEFIEAIEANQLVAPNILDALTPSAQARDRIDIRLFADTLVESGHLSRWQAERLMTGRTAFGLGKYRLLDRIGAGGMGVVLKAVQTDLNRIVAVKVLSRTLLRRPEAVRRFYREAEAAGSLDHPHIVKVLDSDCINGIPFFVMEYVEGRDLHWLVRHRGPLPIEWACEFGRQTALALQHAHDRHLVHRDVKPDNLLLTRRSPEHPLKVKVLDFGLARFTSETPEATGLTSVNEVFGSVDFMSPEQAQSAKTADIRSDIFSLGASLYFTMTAQTPFGGETIMEKLAARITGPPPSLRKLHPEIPSGLADVIEKMMAPNPADRYQTPVEVARALGPYSAGVVGADATTVLPRDPREPIPEPLPSELALENFLGELAETAVLPARRESSFRSSRYFPQSGVSKILAVAVVLLALTVLTVLLVWAARDADEEGVDSAPVVVVWVDDAAREFGSSEFRRIGGLVDVGKAGDSGGDCTPAGMRRALRPA